MISQFHLWEYKQKNGKQELKQVSIYIAVCTVIICTGQNMGTTQISADGCVDKQNLIHMYNGILFIIKKEWNWHAAMWVNPEDTMFSEIEKNTVWFH